MNLITHRHWFGLILSLSLFFMLNSCTVLRSRSIVENKSGFALLNTRLLVLDENTRIVTIGNLETDSKINVTLPASFGEASLKIEFTFKDEPYSSVCGYLEDSMYVVKFIVEEGIKISCEVDLSFF